VAGYRSYAAANAFQRGLRRLASSAFGSAMFRPTLYRVDRLVYRLTGGRRTLASMLAGLPVVMLTTTGAKTGRPRTVPVLGLPTSEGLVVVSSAYGQERHPGWYHNLRANPLCDVALDGQRSRRRAVEATGDRRARIIEEGLKIYPGFEAYERRAANRRIAVWVLEDAP
jgi:deazaflavin-dependent oxidoreductase (nitroreductase family)